jgi:anti-sigma factor RsiW
LSKKKESIMNCEEADLQLSEFLDRTLGGDYFRKVREHLAGCPRCSEELAGLAECRRLVSNLGVVEPPVGLVTRIMADVREAATQRPGILARLFPPIRLKIPLQAAAVVLIGILTVYLYQKEDTSNSRLISITPEPVLSVPQASTKSETEKHPAAPINSPLPNEAKVVSTEPATAMAPGAPPTTASKAGIAESRLESRREKFKSAPIPAQGVTTAQEGSSFPGSLGGRGIGSSVEALRQPGVRPAPFPPDRLSLLSEPIPDYELVVRRLPSQRTDQAAPPASGSHDSLQKQAGGAVSKSGEGRMQTEVSSRGNNSPLEILWFSVPYDKYEQFKKELAAQAVVESEIPVGLIEKDLSFMADRRLSIKVTVLPSAER